MFFTIINNKDLSLLQKNIAFTTKVFETTGLKDEYLMVVVSGNHKLLLEYLLKNKIKAKLILPFLSTDLFGKVYGLEVIEKLHLQPFYLKSSILEEMIAYNQGKLPQYETNYYYLGDLMENRAYSIEKVQFINKELKRNHLLIEDMKLNLRELLIKAIETTIYKEIDDEIISIKDIERTNETFFYDGITEFILMAIKHYKKEDVKEFLKKEFNLKGD